MESGCSPSLLAFLLQERAESATSSIRDRSLEGDRVLSEGLGRRQDSTDSALGEGGRAVESHALRQQLACSCQSS